MRFPFLHLCWAIVTAALACHAQQEVIDRVDSLAAEGRYQSASDFLRRSLANPRTDPAQLPVLRFELDRLERIQKDFPLTETSLFEHLRKAVKDLNWDEYQGWLRERRFDFRDLDGQRRYMVSSVSNLFFRYPELNPRRVPPKNPAAYDSAVLESARHIRQAAIETGKPYVLPKTFRVTMKLDVEPSAAPKGETVRAWLPIPRAYPFQGGFNLRSSSSPAKAIAPETSAIRSLFMEGVAGAKGADFRIEYDYTAHGVRFEVDPGRIEMGFAGDPSAAAFTNSGPHISFGPEVRSLCAKLAGSEPNPYLNAKAFYDWISDNIKYSFAIEYSTIRNLSDYCLTNGFGDCGQEALLFISLCRLSGIPARWQSGWSTFPGAKSIHDWTEIYLEPYGWMPVDPYMGIYAMRYASSLDLARKRELRDFYFGGLDQWRMIANSDHCQELSPAKSALRSDTVDFQRGELECGGRNVYFDQYDYDLTVKEIKLPPSALP